MYFLTILNPELSLKDKFREMIGEDDKEVWNKEVEEAERRVREGAGDAEACRRIRERPGWPDRSGGGYPESVEDGIQENAVVSLDILSGFYYIM